MAITDKQFDTLAQINHVLAGLLVPTLAVAYCPVHNVPFYMAGAFALYAAVKEFWYDQNYETPEVRGSNLRDFLFYLLGDALAIVAYLALKTGL